MWFNPGPNVTLLCVSTNDQMIQSNVVPPYTLSSWFYFCKLPFRLFKMNVFWTSWSGSNWPDIRLIRTNLIFKNILIFQQKSISRNRIRTRGSLRDFWFMESITNFQVSMRRIWIFHPEIICLFCPPKPHWTKLNINSPGTIVPSGDIWCLNGCLSTLNNAR